MRWERKKRNEMGKKNRRKMRKLYVFQYVFIVSEHKKQQKQKQIFFDNT